MLTVCLCGFCPGRWHVTGCATGGATGGSYRLRYRRCYERQSNSHPASYPTNVACNSPDAVSHGVFILLELQRLRTLLKVHPIELHAKLLRACELPAFLAAHVDPTLRAWVRYCGRGPLIRLFRVECGWRRLGLLR